MPPTALCNNSPGWQIVCHPGCHFSVSCMQYWLMKFEPDECRSTTLKKGGVPWFVRNYQARNFMRDAMQVGDLAFFYHLGCATPGQLGVRDCPEPHPDATRF